MALSSWFSLRAMPIAKNKRRKRAPVPNRHGTGSRVGDDLVAACEEMAAHLRGEIELEAHEMPAASSSRF
jgi:hypothetical protein